MERRTVCSPLFLVFFFLPLLSCGRHTLRPDEIERNKVFASILELEDRRSLGGGDFFEANLNSSPYPEVRRWCAVALGRIGDARGLPLLYRASQSPFASVRAAAAFAIGLIEDRELLLREYRAADPMAAETLRILLDDTALGVRIRAIEALGRAGTSADARRIATVLKNTPYNGSPQLRCGIGLGITSLWRLRDPETLPLLRQLAVQQDNELQWRAADALIRLRDKAACPAFLRLLQNPQSDVRAYAALGLGICDDPGRAAELVPLLTPIDKRNGRVTPLPVRINAVSALGLLKSGASVREIEAAVRAAPVEGNNPDQVNFAIAAAAALGEIAAREAESALSSLLEISGPVANSAVIALGRILHGDAERFFKLAQAERFADPPARRAWAQALGELGGPAAIAELKRILMEATNGQENSASALSVPTVLTALARAQAPDLPGILEVYLSSHDGVILRAAVGAYRPSSKTRQPWLPIVRAYAGVARGNDVETKVSILDHLEPWAGEPAVQSILRGALADHLRNVRIAAARLLRKAGVPGVPDFPGETGSPLSRNTYEMLAGSRKDRTVAVIETDRGNVELELFREDAPLTVSNFVALAKGGYFDGQTFMRVVPFFVVQSGDPRNDMEGGPGYSIRCEINMRPFARGSVGMALAGKDTGGSQFFITLAPQPRLDGYYTCFGRVISGMQAVDHLIPGDRIRKVTVTDDVAIFDYRRF